MRFWRVALALIGIIVYSSFSLTAQVSQENQFHEVLTVGKGTAHYVTWHPDSTRFIVNSGRGAWIYDAETFEVLGHLEDLQQAGFSPDGRWIFGRDADERVLIYDTETFESAPFPQGTSQYGISGDGRWITLNNANEPPLLYSSETTLPINMDEDVQAYHFSPDGRWLFLINTDGQNRLYAVRRNEFEPQPLPPVIEEAENVPILWSPDSTQLAIRDGTDLLFWQPGSITVDFVLRDVPDETIGWSPDSSKFTLYPDDGSLTIWSAEDGTLLTHIPPDEQYLAGEYSVARYWSPDGTEIIRYYTSCNIYCDSGTGRVYDARNGRSLTEITIGQEAFTLGYSPDSRYLYLNGIYDATTYEGVNGEFSYYANWSPDSRYLSLTPSFSAGLRLFNSHSQEVVEVEGVDFVTGFAWAPNSQRLIAWNTGGMFWMIDAENADVQHQAMLHPEIRHAVFHPHLPLLALGASDGTVSIVELDATPATVAREIRPDTGRRPIRRLEWQPYGTLLAAQFDTLANYNSPFNTYPLTILDTATGYRSGYLTGTRGFEWHPEGSALASGYNDNVQHWDPETGFITIDRRVVSITSLFQTGAATGIFS
jgi:WD40 repeat protein